MRCSGRSSNREGASTGRSPRKISPSSFRFPPKPQQRRAVDALVIATDVYTWKLLRRDMRRSRPEAIVVMTALVRGVLSQFATDRATSRRAIMKSLDFLFATVDGGGNVAQAMTVVRELIKRRPSGAGSQRCGERWRSERGRRTACALESGDRNKPDRSREAEFIEKLGGSHPAGRIPDSAWAHLRPCARLRP